MKPKGKKPEPSVKREWLDWYRSKAPIFLFGLKFGGLVALLYVLLSFSFFDHLLFYSLQASAWISHFILNVVGQQTHLVGTVIQSPRFSIAIERGCDALEPTWMVVAAILAFPAKRRYRLIGICAIVMLMQLTNLLRIITLFLIGFHFPSAFNTVHLEIWPAVFIIVEVLAFLGWKEWANSSARPHVAS